MLFRGSNRNGSTSLKVILTLSIILMVAALAAGIYYYRDSVVKQEQLAQMEQENQGLITEKDQLTGFIDEITGSINEIGAKLRDVREQRVQITSLMPLAESDTTVKAEILGNIAAIENQLISDRHSLDELEARIKKSGLRIRALEKMVANLKLEIAENQETIAQLNTRITEQQAVIDETKVSLAESREVIKSTEARLEHTRDMLEETKNTAWFVSGSAKELQKKNVIERFGFFSKKNRLSGVFDRQDFNRIDITKVSEFSFDCKPGDIKLVPARATGTYSIEEPEKGRSVLSILDREKFWTVPYLVVVAD